MDIICAHFSLNHTEFQEECFWSDFSESTFGVCIMPFTLAKAQSWEEFGLFEKKSDYDQRLSKPRKWISQHWSWISSCLELGIGLVSNVAWCWQAFASWGIFSSICKSRACSFSEWEEISRLGIRLCFLFYFLLIYPLFFWLAFKHTYPNLFLFL